MWKQPVLGRELGLKSKVWVTLLCLRLVGPHQRTTLSSALVTRTLQGRYIHKNDILPLYLTHKHIETQHKCKLYESLISPSKTTTSGGMYKVQN